MGSPALRFHSIPLGEMPPPAPRACFGRDELVEKVVGLAENLEPVALIGAGGIGKTSIALTVLHHKRTQERFGENRRFIRCDQFPASRTHFLARLSKVIGAGVETPEDLTPLRPFLSSNEMLIILDNAESVLDPQATGARDIYAAVDELCQFKTICICITSRITTVPWHCDRPEIPALSMKAACDIFYGIYRNREQSSIVNNLLQRLDFHALSITLLATTASHNGWDYDRLAGEWDARRAQVLQTDYNESLAATIELSLASPTFRSLGSDGRDLLGVIAFFPQGIDEKNLDWLFPTISSRKNVFDKSCALSLTHRSNGFVTMLAPIRDYLSHQDPQSSPLLCMTRDYYFSRLLVDVNPSQPGFGEARWIVLEDVNVEHLLDVFTSIDPNTDGIWRVCYHFIEHLYWHKPRQITLSSKIEGLPDNHHDKQTCLCELSRLFQRIGNHAERKRLLNHTLELERQQGKDFKVAQTLSRLSDVNLHLGLREEGIKQAKEALGIFEQAGETGWQMRCLNDLAFLLVEDGQLDAAEEAASRAINLAQDGGKEFIVCQLHRGLGNIYQSKGEKKKAIHHLEAALAIASPPNWRSELLWIHLDLAGLFRDERQFDDASAHIERAKTHAVNDAYKLGRAAHSQASVWHCQGRLKDAKLEVSHATQIFEELGAVKEAKVCEDLLQKVEQAMKMEIQSTGQQGKRLGTTLHPTPVDFRFLV